MDELLETLKQRAPGVRVADVVDILVVAVLIYAGLTWLRRAQSRFVVAGLGGAAALYFTARLLEMYLTLFIFQAVLTVAVVALVIIFQEDIRRAFERVAMRTRLAARRSTAAPLERTVELVARVAARLAAQRVGALIVFKGKEPLERHLSSGVALEGRLSEALLYSIFDPSSPGHDGAVVIDHDLVDRFGVHLPLSRIPGSEGRGTRHSAAIGLTERSDALVVVVSEERGRVSVAEHGVLTELGVEELVQRLTDFLKAPGPDAMARRRTRGRLWLKLLSLTLAVAAWAVVSRYESEMVSRTFTVPVAYRNAPEEWLLERTDPSEVRVTLSGSLRAFQTLEADTLTATLDLSRVREGRQSLPVNADDVDVPRDLGVLQVEPRSVELTAYPAERVTLPVEPRITGRVPPGHKLKSLDANPPRVIVLVPQSRGQRPAALRTEPVDVSGLTETTTVTRRVSLPAGVHTPDAAPIEVEVTANVAPIASARP